MQRVTELTSPPVIGKRYLVPTVEYIWGPGQRNKTPRPWPVLGPMHRDPELNFDLDHYHVDSRFVSERAYRSAANYSGGTVYRDVNVVFEGVPLNRADHHWDDKGVRTRSTIPHPPVVWRPLTCKRELHKVTRVPELARKIEASWVGKTCKRGKHGFICPHRNLPLGTIAPVDGVITCPLHGLRIDAATGVVLPTASA